MVLHHLARSFNGLVRIVDEFIADKVLPLRMAQLPHALHKFAFGAARAFAINPSRSGGSQKGSTPNLARSALRRRSERNDQRTTPKAGRSLSVK